MRSAEPVADRMKIFISYSRDDLSFADQLDLALRDMGFEPLVDRRAINPAEPWQDRLGSLLSACDTVVFVLTEGSLASDACKWEVERAKSLGKRMIPVLPGLLNGSVVPAELSLLNYVYFYPDRNAPGGGFYSGLRQLEQALKQDLEWLRQATRLGERAVEWSHGRPEDLLLLGQPLSRAREWLDRIPIDATVSPLVREYLNACEEADHRRSTKLQREQAEREQALKAAVDQAVEQAEEALRTRETALQEASAATSARARAQRLLGILSGLAMSIGVVLTAFAIAGLYFALNNSVQANDLRSSLFAREARGLSMEGRHTDAMLMAISGDPAAQRGSAERFFRPEGYPAAVAALEEAFNGNHLQRIFDGHAGEVIAVAFSPDGKRILTGSQDNTARLWSEDGKALAVLEGHQDAVSSVAFSPDARLVVTGSFDATARIWSADGKALSVLGGHQGPVVATEFSPDGRTVLTASIDGTVRLWSALDGNLLRTFTSDAAAIYSAAFSPDGSSILTGAADGTARLWSLDGRLLTSLGGLAGAVSSVAFSPDGTRLLTGSDDKTARLWSSDGSLIASFSGHAGAVRSVSYSADGKNVLTGSTDGTVKLWTVDGKEVTTFRITNPDADGGDSSVVTFSRDGATILAGSSDNRARIFSVLDQASIAGPVKFSSPSELVARACAKLRDAGASEFTQRDRQQFVILGGLPSNPCARL